MDANLREAHAYVAKDEFAESVQILERYLDFNRWGFTKVFSGVGSFSPIVVYASEACRVKFSWQLPDLRDRVAIIHVYYGRSHAPVDEEIITWEGQKCYCWHDVEKALYFLDGLSPSDVAKNKFGLPKVIDELRRSSSHTNWTHAEYKAKMHAAIWNHYGQRLFDLFDLRHPSLWVEYSRFITECESLDPGFSLSGYPTWDKVC